MRILLVEDHADLAANVDDYLCSCGHQVTLAGDGERGLELMRRKKFGAVIIDRMLPGIDGVSLCREMRSGAQAGVPVLMLTAMDTLADKLDGFAAGADDYLVKPFALAELGARIEALARRPALAAAPTNTLQLADLIYDPDTCEARRGGRLLRLNPTTRAILEFLLRASPRVVAHEELERAIWGDKLPAKGVLRVHVYALRSALDGGRRRKLLRTLHGIGYRIADAEDR